MEVEMVDWMIVRDQKCDGRVDTRVRKVEREHVMWCPTLVSPHGWGFPNIEQFSNLLVAH